MNPYESPQYDVTATQVGEPTAWESITCGMFWLGLAGIANTLFHVLQSTVPNWELFHNAVGISLPLTTWFGVQWMREYLTRQWRTIR